MKEELEGWKDTPSLFCSAQCLSLANSKSNRLLANSCLLYSVCVEAALKHPSWCRLSKGIDMVALIPSDRLLFAFCPVLVGT